MFIVLNEWLSSVKVRRARNGKDMVQKRHSLPQVLEIGEKNTPCGLGFSGWRSK